MSIGWRSPLRGSSPCAVVVVMVVDSGDSCDGGDEGNGVDDNGIDCVDSNSHDDVGCVSPPLLHNHFDVLLGLLQ